ncbi:hypothetical protein ACS0TY_019623 [Phlomoides rotata]
MPTRDALRKRGIIQGVQESKCPCCEDAEESVMHLFFECGFAWSIWSEIFKWTATVTVGHHDPKRNLEVFSELLGGRKSSKIDAAIWLATIGSIWRVRNKLVFEGEKLNKLKIIGEIKATIWSWIVTNIGKKKDLSFANWCRCPRG